MNPNQETFNTWNKIASLYQDKFMDLDVYNDTYDHICYSIDKHNAKILDIGCGPGNISKYLLSKRTDFDLLGIDIAPNMIELAIQNNPNANFKVMDVRLINNIQSNFDAIIAGFCVPYLSSSETKQLIENSFKLLNDNGLLYISFVEGDPNLSEYKDSGNGRVFFNYHSLDEIQSNLIECNFKDIELFKVNYKTSETNFDIHTIMIARK